MGRLLRTLIVEDSEDDAALLLRELRRGGYEPAYERVDTAEALNAALDRQEWDIVFADYSMPHFNGLAALKILRSRGLDVPFIFVSGTIGEDMAVEAMRCGAHDYIMKGNLKRLLPAVDRELNEARVRLAHRQAEAKIHRMAYYDAVTGLPNRNMVYDRLMSAVRADAGAGAAMALLLIDLDHFREVNDTLGHGRGDTLLREVGLRMKAVMRPADVIARLGGDEFAVFLPVLASPSHAGLVAQKVEKALEEPFIIDALPIAVEASIGIALYPEHGDNADALMQRADVAMYAAKRSGAGHLIYDAAHDHHSPRRLALMGDLRQAIENNELKLHYQPRIEMKSEKVTGCEALARWTHPEYGPIPPDQFILPAERTGLIKQLALWAFDEAQNQALKWHRGDNGLTVSVNLSARNLLDPRLPDQISELMQAAGVPADRLEMEVTESAVMADPIRALDAIKRIRAMGIRFAIDDFGVSYSSLSYLKQLPVDSIKIDKSFVINMAKSQNDAVIVRSTIDMAHNLGLKVVAEGVETKDAWDRLKTMGCDEAQGYFMCRPLPADELGKWLRESPYGVKKGKAGSGG